MHEIKNLDALELSESLLDTYINAFMVLDLMAILYH